MRIARYLDADHERVGIVHHDRVVDVRELDAHVPRDVVAILEQGTQLWQRLQRAAAEHPGRPLDAVQLLAPIARPSKFLAVGFNSEDHLEEARAAAGEPALAEMFRAHELVQKAFPAPRFPAVFNKQTTSIVGPGDPIWVPRDSPQVDYEGEVALVIGKRVRRADERDAAEAIAGWTVTNDVTVRDWQWNTSQVWLGKSFDTHGPIGPWIVTADEFDPAQAVIRTWVNGELRQNGRLSDQTLSPAQIVSQLSQVCTLEPGDLIATGTPAGIGTISGRYLAAGDRVRVSVSGIGEIDNDVIDEPAVTR